MGVGRTPAELSPPAVRVSALTTFGRVGLQRVEGDPPEIERTALQLVVVQALAALCSDDVGHEQHAAGADAPASRYLKHAGRLHLDRDRAPVPPPRFGVRTRVVEQVRRRDRHRGSAAAVHERGGKRGVGVHALAGAERPARAVGRQRAGGRQELTQREARVDHVTARPLAVCPVYPQRPRRVLNMRGDSRWAWAIARARCGSPGRTTRSASSAAGRMWIGVPGIAGTIWDTPRDLADRKSTPPRLPDAVREAVERTLEATRESAQTTRTRAQDAVDEIVRGAEAGAGAVRERVRDVIDERRPATSDDLRELRAELRAIRRRLDAIEERLPASRSAPKRTAARRSGSRGQKK